MFSIKGGLGKTAAAVNLSYLAARDYARTLVWDLDPQAASTFYFRIRPKLKGGVAKLLRPTRAIDRLIKGTDFDHLDVLPADSTYRKLDLLLDDLKRPTRGIRRVLKPLGTAYDYVFMDCPPSLSLLSENVLRAADALVVPTIPTTLSLRTLQQLESFCESEGVMDKLRILPFLSMVDRRKKLHREVCEQLLAERPNMLRSQIPYASMVEQMGVERAPLPSYAGWTPAAHAYAELWRELQQKLK